MKNFKRLFAIVISVALLLCSIPMVASAEVPAIPELATKYTVVDSLAGQWGSADVPAGANMYASGNPVRMAGWLPGMYVFTADKLQQAEYIELDVYVSEDVDSPSACFVVTDGWDGAENYGKYYLSSSLKAGWNHVVLEASACSSKGGVWQQFNLNSYDKWNSVFWDGTLSADKDVTIAYGNVALTTANQNPVMNNTYEFVESAQQGIFWRWKHAANTASNWQAHNVIGYNTLNAGNSKYMEFDLYVNEASDGFYLWLSNASGDGGPRQRYQTGALVKGWNHVVITLSNVLEGSGVDLNARKYFYMHPITPSFNIDYVFANIAFTTDIPTPPAMDNEKDFVVASKEGIFWTKEGIAADYHMPPSGSDNNPSWYGHLDTTYDATDAEFVELDVYSSVAVDAQIWVSSAAWADAGRARREAPFALAKGWNHICLDLNSLNITSGTLNRAAVKNIFLELITPAAAESVTLSMANLSFTSEEIPVPAINNTYNLIAETVTTLNDDGEPNQKFDGAVTVPAGAALYPNYMMWRYIEPVDMTNAEFIEMDIYVSADTNGFGM